jgi:hypothetical protein
LARRACRKFQGPGGRAKNCRPARAEKAGPTSIGSACARALAGQCHPIPSPRAPCQGAEPRERARHARTSSRNPSAPPSLAESQLHPCMPMGSLSRLAPLLCSPPQQSPCASTSLQAGVAAKIKRHQIIVRRHESCERGRRGPLDRSGPDPRARSASSHSPARIQQHAPTDSAASLSVQEW